MFQDMRDSLTRESACSVFLNLFYSVRAHKSSEWSAALIVTSREKSKKGAFGPFFLFLLVPLRKN